MFPLFSELRKLPRWSHHVQSLTEVCISPCTSSSCLRLFMQALLRNPLLLRELTGLTWSSSLVALRDLPSLQLSKVSILAWHPQVPSARNLLIFRQLWDHVKATSWILGLPNFPEEDNFSPHWFWALPFSTRHENKDKLCWIHDDLL